MCDWIFKHQAKGPVIQTLFMLQSSTAKSAQRVVERTAKAYRDTLRDFVCEPGREYTYLELRRIVGLPRVDTEGGRPALFDVVLSEVTRGKPGKPHGRYW